MKEIVIISGKGGTGKTSLTAAFASLARSCVLADCDVDASDLHLVLEPRIEQEAEFSGGKQARIIPESCSGCGVCAEVCRFGAVQSEAGIYRIDPIACEGCGVCAWFCPEQAVDFSDAVNGTWFVSQTRVGPMVHARLGIAEENSGKLVTLVRKEARARAAAADYLLVDGSPGIGCPVIASITGADLVVVVTEPTVSGIHDLERVAQLADNFRIPAMVCINKHDLNPDMSARIIDQARSWGLTLAGTVRYDRAFSDAQVQRATVVEYTRSAVADDIRAVWANIESTAGKLD